MLNRLEMLRIFCTAAESSSFKEAANRLGISPQAVTRAVKELERLQGVMPFT
ncbi:helix-turn-helix domain-containing protein [Alteromonas macleodii]|uniref:helix-turn-helix domain-containing protein n=1 Tax=Alteromonas macleodii TaxID=28108 RepID=UPI0036699B3A